MIRKKDLVAVSVQPMNHTSKLFFKLVHPVNSVVRFVDNLGGYTVVDYGDVRVSKRSCKLTCCSVV